MGYVSHSASVRKVDNWENNEESTNPIMTWAELRELRDIRRQDGSPLIEIIPHSVGHHDLDELKKNHGRLVDEIRGSKQALMHRLHIPSSEIKFFCLPYGGGWKDKGNADQCVNTVLRDEGYIGALRAQYKTGEPWDQYCIPRWDIGTQTIETVLKAIADVNRTE